MAIGDFVPCQYCNGHGKVDSQDLVTKQLIKAVCQRCKGQGRILDETKPHIVHPQFNDKPTPPPPDFRTTDASTLSNEDLAEEIRKRMSEDQEFLNKLFPVDAAITAPLIVEALPSDFNKPFQYSDANQLIDRVKVPEMENNSLPMAVLNPGEKHPMPAEKKIYFGDKEYTMEEFEQLLKEHGKDEEPIKRGRKRSAKYDKHEVTESAGK